MGGNGVNNNKQNRRSGSRQMGWSEMTDDVRADVDAQQSQTLTDNMRNTWTRGERDP